jgi:4-hydroxy-tetrahydrodipicolinate synthase
MVVAALNKDEVSARRIDEKLKGLHQYLFIETSPIPTKWALHKMNFINSGLRLPMIWLSVECEEKLSSAMVQAGIR